jgi:mRNA interferase MazF
MTNYRTGDLLLVMFPFAHGGRGKQRPAIVLLDDGDDGVLLARVTTQDRHTGFDIRITEWQGAGLLAPSVVRLHKLATIQKSLVKRHLGSLSERGRASVASTLSQIWQAW